MNLPTSFRHVEGPGKFNEEAFKAYDKVLQIANKVGIRVIIPLVDNWWWWGGPKEYAAFRGKQKDEFRTQSLPHRRLQKNGRASCEPHQYVHGSSVQERQSNSRMGDRERA